MNNQDDNSEKLNKFYFWTIGIIACNFGVVTWYLTAIGFIIGIYLLIKEQIIKSIHVILLNILSTLLGIELVDHYILANLITIDYVLVANRIMHVIFVSLIINIACAILINKFIKNK